MEPDAYIQMAEVESTHWWYVGRRAIVSCILDAIDLAPDCSILEVGAGTGGNLQMLRRYGKVQAMEPDPIARRLAERSSGISVLDGSLPDRIPFRDEQFDLICMLDVLEHVNDDRGSLAALAVHLKARGRIVVTVPAYSWMWSEHDRQLHHFRRYSRKTLRAAFADTGLLIEKIANFNSIFFPGALAARSLSKLLGHKKPPGTELPNPILNRLFASTFAAERLMVRRGVLPFGLSILAIGKKR